MKRNKKIYLCMYKQKYVCTKIKKPKHGCPKHQECNQYTYALKPKIQEVVD